MRTLLVILAGLTVANPTLAAPKRTWQAFADCAAAYEVNAAIKDSGRSQTMAGDMAAIADDYSRVAAQRLGVSKTSFRAAEAVKERVSTETPRFAAMTREQLDRFIDACPQIGG